MTLRKETPNLGVMKQDKEKFHTLLCPFNVTSIVSVLSINLVPSFLFYSSLRSERTLEQRRRREAWKRGFLKGYFSILKTYDHNYHFYF